MSRSGAPLVAPVSPRPTPARLISAHAPQPISSIRNKQSASTRLPVTLHCESCKSDRSQRPTAQQRDRQLANRHHRLFWGGAAAFRSIVVVDYRRGGGAAGVSNNLQKAVQEIQDTRLVPPSLPRAAACLLSNSAVRPSRSLLLLLLLVYSHITFFETCLYNFYGLYSRRRARAQAKGCADKDMRTNIHTHTQPHATDTHKYTHAYIHYKHTRIYDSITKPNETKHRYSAQPR